MDSKLCYFEIRNFKYDPNELERAVAKHLSTKWTMWPEKIEIVHLKPSDHPYLHYLWNSFTIRVNMSLMRVPPKSKNIAHIDQGRLARIVLPVVGDYENQHNYLRYLDEERKEVQRYYYQHGVPVIINTTIRHQGLNDSSEPRVLLWLNPPIPINYDYLIRTYEEGMLLNVRDSMENLEMLRKEAVPLTEENQKTINSIRSRFPQVSYDFEVFRTVRKPYPQYFTPPPFFIAKTGEFSFLAFNSDHEFYTFLEDHLRKQQESPLT